MTDAPPAAPVTDPCLRSTVGPPSEGDGPVERQPEPSPPSVRRRTAPHAVVAVLVWLALLAPAYTVPRLLAGNPFSNQARALVLAAAFVGVAVVATPVWRWRRRGSAGIAAGMAAGWCAFLLQMSLTGTPFGFGGMQGDMARMSGLVTRYADTILPRDAWVPGVAAEYPMLYPWLVGRTAVLLDRPGWQLLGEAETLFMSGAVLAAFLLWQRWVPGWAAFAIAVTSVSIFGDPRKAFEVLALAIFIPWVLGTFGRPPTGRLPWAVAGAIAGGLYLLYPGWLLYGVPALLVLAWLAWRREPRRRQYLAYLAKAAAVAVAVAAWQLLPYLWAMLTTDPETVSDLYNPPSLHGNMFPLVAFTPLGLLQLVGFVGLVWLVRSTWWALPLLALALGAFGYRVLMMLRFAATDHTMFLHYSSRLYAVVLATGGVLVICHLATRLPRLTRRTRLDPAALRRVGVAALALAVAWLGYTYANEWMPDRSGGYAAQAHLEPLPAGGYPRYAPASGRADPFPAREVEQFVTGVPGLPARPVVLSTDERLFGYLPWYGYLGVDRTASSALVRWDSREAELRRLAAVADPTAFAAAARQTTFGPIDVFVLRRDGDVLHWNDLTFTPAQFDTPDWATADLTSDIFVAARLDGP